MSSEGTGVSSGADGIMMQPKTDLEIEELTMTYVELNCCFTSAAAIKQTACSLGSYKDIEQESGKR